VSKCLKYESCPAGVFMAEPGAMDAAAVMVAAGLNASGAEVDALTAAADSLGVAVDVFMA